MHAPCGFSGVHTFEKRGQSHGEQKPVITSPHLHPLFFALSSVRFLLPASNASYSFLSAIPEFLILPIPRQTASQGSKYFCTISFAF